MNGLIKKQLVITLLWGNFCFANSIIELINDAIGYDPNYKITQNEIESAAANLDIQRAKFLPKLSLQTTISRENIYNSLVDTTSHDVSLMPKNVSLVFTEEIFNGLRNINAYKAKQSSLTAAIRNNKNEINKLIFDVATAAINVALEENIYNMAQENVTIEKNTLKIVNSKYKSGITSKHEKSLAQASLDLESIALIDAKTSYENAKENFFVVVGKKYQKQFNIPDIQENYLPKNLDEFKNEITIGNNKLIALQAEVDSKNYTLKEDSQFLMPSLSANASYDYTKGQSGEIDTTDKTKSIYLSLNWNLFNGGSDVATKRKAYADKTKAQNNLFAEKNNILTSAYSVWNDYVKYKNLHKLLILRKKNLKSAYIGYQNKFKIASADISDVLQAQKMYYAARNDYIINLYNFKKATYKIAELTNKLSSIFMETTTNKLEVAND